MVQSPLAEGLFAKILLHYASELTSIRFFGLLAFFPSPSTRYACLHLSYRPFPPRDPDSIQDRYRILSSSVAAQFVSRKGENV